MNNQLVHYIDSTSKTINLSIDCTKYQLKKKAELYIIVFEQQRKIGTYQIGQPFPKIYQLINLKHQTIYTLKIRLENGQENQFQTLYCNTKSDPNVVVQQIIKQNQQIQVPHQDNLLSQSEQQLMDVIIAENEGINIFNSKQQVKSLIQKARNNSGARGFIHSEYKVNRPPHLKQERLQRIWMIAKGQQFYDEVYGNIDEGMQFMKNDWFMGPFYSYDINEKMIRQEKERNDLQINTNESL